MSDGEKVLEIFEKRWRSEFNPDLERKWSFDQKIWSNGKGGWLISREWSFYLMNWLKENFSEGKVVFEVGCGNKRRLDAALWLLNFEGDSSPEADLAIEWEWDNNKAYNDFSKKGGDFEKILSVSAKAGLAIIQTRADGGRGENQAKATIEQIIKCNREKNTDGRPIGVIELRRIPSNNSECKFKTLYYNLANPDNKKELLEITFPKSKDPKN